MQLPLDAFPDTTPVQVQINTVAPELPPEEVERLITFPVEYALGGLKGLRRGPLGLEVRPLAGRRHLQRRHRHLLRPPADQRAAGRGRAPRGDRPADDGAGGDRPGRGLPLPADQRRLRPDRAADLAGLGDPAPAAARAGRRRDQLVGRIGEAIRGPRRPGQAGQVQADARRCDRALCARTTRTSAAAPSPARARRAWCRGSAAPAQSRTSPGVTIAAHDGVPIRVKDVATVAVGHVIRRGGVTANGQGEAVLGLGFMRMGENSREVTRALDAALDDVPQGAAARRQHRASSTSAPTSSTRCSRPSSGTCSKGRCWSSPCCSPSWATSGPG